MNIFKNLKDFKQHTVLLLLKSHLSIFIFVLFVLNVSQVTFSQETEFTEANGWSRHPNGGGLVHRDANISPAAEIGPNVKVYGGIINKDADIRGRVVVRGGTINKGLINGDAVIRGGLIEDGTVTGNAVVRGGTISGGADVNGGTIFDGRIEGGRIDGNVEITGGTIRGGFISGNAKISGGIIEDGIIDGKAEISGGRITDGYIHGDAKVRGGTISGDTTDIFGGTISGNAEVRGGVTYGRADIRGGTISENARVSGGTIYEGAEVSGGRVSGRAEVRGKVTGGRVDGNAVIPRGAVVREGMHINDDRLLSRFGKLKKRALKNLPYIGRVVAVGSTLYQMLKTDLSANELENLAGSLIGEVLYSKDLDSSDLPFEDYLQNLKTAAQKLSSTRIFSKERQSLTNELNSVSTDIQADESLSDEEKQQYLKTIAEVQDIVQPPSPPRHPPNHRNIRGTSGGIR